MPGSANDEFFDALVRHQTYLLRYSANVRNRVNALLDKAEDDIVGRVLNKLREYEGGLHAPVEVRRMEALMAAVAKLRGEAWDDVLKLYTEEMTALAYQEPITTAGILRTVAPVVIETVLPAPRLLKAIALSRPFEGRLLRDWVANLRSNDVARINAQIQIGMVAGETGPQIAKRVAGTGLLKNRDGVTQATRNAVEMITRTAVMHVANSARAEFMRENVDVIEGELYVATLDARTTAVCKANDGKIFPVGQGPRPPLHIGCRSLRVAALDGGAIGERPFKSSTTRQLLDEFTDGRKLDRVSNRDDLPRGTKGAYDAFARKRVRELTGRADASTSYQAWLEKQTKAFQDDTLGPTKAKLFRDGGLKLDQYVAADGSELTLAELATKHPAAFRAAGLDPLGY